MSLTPRAVLAGSVFGLLLAAGNVYMGLRTGFWEIGIVTATVLAAAVYPLLGRRLDATDATITQSIATGTGAAPAVAGLLGAVPALELMGAAPPAWTVVAFGIGAGVLGLLLAHGLRRRLLEEEALPFPSGIAAAEVLRTHAGSGARALTVSGVLAAALTALRDGPGLVPAMLLTGGRAGALGLGVALSPMLAGAGALVGVANASALAAGSALAFFVITPILVRTGAIADVTFVSSAAWLLWPGVGLVLGGSVASLAADLRAFGAGVADLGALLRGASRSRVALAFTVGAAILMVGAAHVGFGLHLGVAALVAVPSLLGAVACARVAGRTDVAPIGEVGQVLQGGAGALGTGALAATAAGALPSSVGGQAAISLWSLRAGARLGVPPALQLRAQFLGIVLGIAAAVPLYRAFVHAHALGSVELPAPTALRWRALAEAVGGGGHLPHGALLLLVAGTLVGALLELASRGRLRGKVPTPGALGLGFLVPAHYVGTMLLGALLGAWQARRGRGTVVEPVAAGAIVGESLVALIAAAVASGAGPR
ncbi:oligopeptide transporters, OPT superfamily [Anaeromyxobacter sp. K]|uniref:OPT/YSL family transporter n=1 Tax=Anaeromyxobacter sp. (strain K) TaxID=447217 RepID=UPI00015F885A|nr:OPT/YSL family transporter [Anaeromyxobacter sp. K]ACG73269.1 oligopeptide transporters, OPT superfamily [Anaeromyxobacter sp. K]